MDLRTLKLFCDTARSRSVSRAAATHRVSQSAASQAIQQLEAELGVALIDRRRRPLGLTEEGRLFLEGCESLLAGFARLRERIAATRESGGGSVRVAALYSIGMYSLGEYIRRFLASSPGTKLHLEYLPPRRIPETILADEADLAILAFPPPDRAFTVIPWRAERMVFVCRPDHALARQPVVAAGELRGLPFVAFEADLGIRQAIDRSLRRHRTQVAVVAEFDSIETIKQSVAIGTGVSILPEVTVRREVEEGTLAASHLAMPDLVRRVVILHRKGKVFTPAGRKFLEFLCGVPVPGPPSVPPGPSLS